MSFLKVSDSEIRAPEMIVLPDSRKRLVRYFKLPNRAVMPPGIDLAWGTQDQGAEASDAPAGWTDLYLVKREVDDHSRLFTVGRGEDSLPILKVTYEQIQLTGEQQVGGYDFAYGPAVTTTLVLHFLQWSTVTATPGTPGSTTAPTPYEAYVLKEEKTEDNGTLRKIERTYISAGEIDTTTETRNNGALLIQTAVYVNQVPPTPSGYTLITAKEANPGGLPVYTYTFAKGTGQVSLDTEYRLSPNQGTSGVTVATIRYLSVPSVTSNPITPPSPPTGAPAYQLIKVSPEDVDGHRVWTAIYATGQGTIDSKTDIRVAGMLVIYTATAINAAPSTPAATIGGTVTLVSSDTRNGARFENGTIIYDYRWVEANGQSQQRIITRTDGLREVEAISMGTKVTPSGVVIQDDYRVDEGYTIYTVRTMQALNGDADPTSQFYQEQRLVTFPYPGRALPVLDNSTMSPVQFLDVRLSPPVEVPLPGVVTIRYQKNNSTPNLTGGTYWAPTDWAEVHAVWIGIGGGAANPMNQVTAYRGYRTAVAGTPPLSSTVSATYGSLTTNGGTCMGRTAYGGTSASVTVKGGPVDPGGKTWVMEAKTEVAFISTTGDIYYRSIVVTVAVPAQATWP